MARRVKTTTGKAGTTAAGRRVLAGVSTVTTAPSQASDGHLLQQNEYVHVLFSLGGTAPVFRVRLYWYFEVSGKWHKGNQIENQYSQWVWRQYASAFWDDVRIDRTLGAGASLYSANKADKDEPDEKHMHPLQLDVIERAVAMWSNPGENVLTPFMGVGSEAYGAVINNRRAIGIELKESYYRQAKKNIDMASKPDAGEDEMLYAAAEPEAEEA
jgi:hypothetical protein